MYTVLKEPYLPPPATHQCWQTWHFKIGRIWDCTTVLRLHHRQTWSHGVFALSAELLYPSFCNQGRTEGVGVNPPCAW